MEHEALFVCANDCDATKAKNTARKWLVFIPDGKQVLYHTEVGVGLSSEHHPSEQPGKRTTEHPIGSEGGHCIVTKKGRMAVCPVVPMNDDPMISAMQRDRAVSAPTASVGASFDPFVGVLSSVPTALADYACVLLWTSSFAPHSGQNFMPLAISAPHFAHVVFVDSPHSGQNLA